MEKELAQKAIKFALQANWKKAIEVNKAILKNDPQNIDALNRLSRAYAETGDLFKAKKTAQKVLKINPYDTIASKSLDKWSKLKKPGEARSHPINPDLFIEEPGKTKMVSLLHLGDHSSVIAKLDSGDEVKIDSHSHRICINTPDDKYIGRLPDDLSAKLKKLISMGNEYKAYIKSTSNKDVKVILRETKRVEKLKDIPSFPLEKLDYVSFTPPELVHEKASAVSEDEIEEEI